MSVGVLDPTSDWPPSSSRIWLTRLVSVPHVPSYAMHTHHKKTVEEEFGFALPAPVTSERNTGQLLSLVALGNLFLHHFLQTDRMVLDRWSKSWAWTRLPILAKGPPTDIAVQGNNSKKELSVPVLPRSRNCSKIESLHSKDAPDISMIFIQRMAHPDVGGHMAQPWAVHSPVVAIWVVSPPGPQVADL